MENLAHPADFFSRVAVMAYAPARGTGMKVKVLESMAYGVPVVTTAEGAEGLDVRGRRALRDPRGRRGAGRGDRGQLATTQADGRCGRPRGALVEARYSREPFLTQMLALYDRVQQL